MKRKNDKLELILLGVGDSPAAVIVCCEAPSGCAGRDSDSRKQDGDDGRQKAGGDDTEHGTGKRGFSEQ